MAVDIPRYMSSPCYFQACCVLICLTVYYVIGKCLCFCFRISSQSRFSRLCLLQISLNSCSCCRHVTDCLDLIPILGLFHFIHSYKTFLQAPSEHFAVLLQTFLGYVTRTKLAENNEPVYQTC